MVRSVVTNASYLDVNTGKFMENQAIVMKNRKFVWIGDNGDYEKEEGDVITDASGKFVVPGMMDVHVHLMADATPGKEWEQEMTMTTDRNAIVMLTNAQRYVAAGFTTVRDLASLSTGLAGVKHTLNHMEYAGARVFGASTMLRQPGTQEFEYPDFYVEYLKKSRLRESKSGPIGMIDAVRHRISLGADWIKIEGTGGVLHGEHSNLKNSFFTDEELQAIVSETHRSGRFVASHCHGDEGIRRGTEAGIDTIEHGSFITEETAKLMLKKGNYLIPTTMSGEMLRKPDIVEKMPPSVQNRERETMAITRKQHKLAFDMGVNMALGTDAGTPGNYHGTCAREMQYYTDLLGATNLKAMQMATIEAAKAIKQEANLGSIEVGKSADLVIMEKNPLDDIKVVQNYQNQTHVFRDGVLMAEKGKIVFTLDINR